MTSFAFILGCVPLWVAKDPEPPEVLGTVASQDAGGDTLAIFLIPLFVEVEKLATWSRSRKAR